MIARQPCSALPEVSERSTAPRPILKRIDNRYLRRVRWFGAKSALAAVLRIRPINAIAEWVGRRILPARLHQRMPVRKGSVVYRMADGQAVELADAHRDLVARDFYWGGSRPTSAAEVHKLKC